MRILVTGASGQLGAYLLARLARDEHEVVAWSGTTGGLRAGVELRPVDLAARGAVEQALGEADPDVVLHAAAVGSADAVYRDPARAWAVNVGGTQCLVDWVASRHRRLLYTSTDLVFDGSRSWYREDDPAEPVLKYGRTKRAAELLVLAIPGGLVARVSLLFGPSCSGKEGFFDRALASLRAGVSQAFFADEFRTPLDYITASEILVRLAGTSVAGLVHVGGKERLSRFELMRRAARALDIDPSLVRSNRRAEMLTPEPRPADVSLATSRLDELIPDLDRPPVEAALAAFGP